MYIEEILKTPDCTMKLSCFDPETKGHLDFNATLLTDPAIKGKIDAFLAKKSLTHYIVVNNIIYDKKSIDFSSHNVESTLFATLKTGNTYKWSKVAVSFIRIGKDNYATCIVSKTNAMPYNRRDTFRIPVDCDGFVFWEGDDMPEKCVVKDVSHDGIGILMEKTRIKLLKGLPATISWEETAYFDSNDHKSTKNFKVQGEVVRRNTGLDGDMIIGFRVPKEPEPIRDYIQWAQTHRGFIQENKPQVSVPKGVQRQENWELEKQLEEMKDKQ